MLATGVVVAGVALLGRWAVRLLLYHDYGAHDALPWLALGWALYGLYLIFVVISGRARRTRRNLPAALAGLAVNIAGLFLLVPRLGISGAGIGLGITGTPGVYVSGPKGASLVQTVSYPTLAQVQQLVTQYS